MLCANCQNPIQPGEKFCGKCGNNTEINKSLRIFWLVLIGADVISVPIVGLVLLTELIFGADSGGVSILVPLLLVPLVGIALFALYSYNFVLFAKKKKSGIIISLICALPVLFFVYYFFLRRYTPEKKQQRQQLERETAFWDCYSDRRKTKYPNIAIKDLPSDDDVEKICEGETGFNRASR